jgi:AcrR family transcriptional regulator
MNAVAIPSPASPAPLKTRERILKVSLELFNAQGEPNVTTNHIADEMEISPGNLYYHFRNKDQIIYELFERFEKRMDETLVLPSERRPDMEDMWLYLHLVFETIWNYRFLYRDLVDLLSRNKKLKTHFSRLVERKIEMARSICRALASEGAMSASDDEIQSVAQNIALVTTFWLSFHAVRQRSGTLDSQSLAQGIYQVLSLVSGYLEPAERDHLQQLARAYLN